MTTLNQRQKTIVIAGVNGDIGQEFAANLANYGILHGISRGPKKASLRYSHIRANLLDESEVRMFFDQITLSDDLLYVHLPGKFRFEDKNHPITDKNGDGVDDEIYETNVTTFRNVKPLLLGYLDNNPNSKLKIVGIGSTSDLYEIPFWQSFTRAKNELRKEFRAIYGLPHNYGRVSSLFINVSTTEGSQLAIERPFISKDFVLKPKDILSQSLPYILDNRPSFLEISVIKPNPNFTTDLERVRAEWYKNMYGNSQIKNMKGGKE